MLSSFFSLIINLAHDFDKKVLFFEFRILATIFLVPVWLYFVSSVFDRWNWLRKKWVMVLVFAPCVVNFLIMLIPKTQPLLFTDFRAFSFYDVSFVQFKFGSLYGVFYSWSMVLMLMSYVLSVITFVQEKGIRRRQVLVINLGLAAALVQSLLSFWFEDPKVLEDILSSNVSLLITQIGIMYAVLRHRLLSIVPLAMERIFQQLPDPVLVIDDHNRLMGASDKALRFFNLKLDYLGRRIEDILPSASLIPGEVALPGPGDSRKHFYLTMEKIGKDPENSPGTVVFFRDIEEQKNVEFRLQEGLEFRARLLAFLAHDLTGFVESQAVIALDLQRKVDQSHQSQLELLTSSAMASQQLVQNVMSWVQTQSMRFKMDSRPFDWRFLIEESLEQMEGHLRVKGIEVHFNCTQDPVVALGDSEMLGSVIRNVLSNSVRASSSGRKIFIDLELGIDCVQIKVRDEGCGIDGAELQRILETSSEFLVSGVSKAQGSGIGLMLVRHFISLHRGRFDMKSQLGIGTAVFISVPL